MTQFLDFVGMFVFCSMLISFNFRRAGWISDQNKIYSFIVLNIILHGSWIWMHFEKMKYQILVFYCILAIVGSELYIRQKIKPNIQYKNLLITLGFFVVAGIFSYLDVSGIWCQPENKLLHGHALWHMLNGTGLYFAYRFYHQFSFTQNS
jgi:hypothetical protein